MTRKIITFLGTTPKDTVYEYGGKPYPGRVFARALYEFVPFDTMYVFVTKEAREKSYPVLEELQDERIQAVDIEAGKDAQEMWGWFDKILECVDSGDTVIFDITHGLRSIPFLVFIFAAFLKSARNVTIEAIYYGAFELGDAKTGKPAPVIELSEFVSMFDWLSAVNEFLYTGNARYLAEQLTRREQPALQPLAGNVGEISLGLELLRPRDVAEASREISQHLKSVADALPKPFGVVAQPLEMAYARFGLPPTADVREHLRAQLRMINWYYEKQQFVHTLSMAREWIVSLLCVEFGVDMWDKDARGEMEFLLSGGVRKEGGVVVEESPCLDRWKQWQYRKRISRLWSGEPFELANLRNDVLHSGFRKNSQPAADIVEQAEKIVHEINEIAELWNLA
ncbi:MAG: TIGR02221 family CRISPR-associated protein [Chloroflexota bacterium]